MLPEWFKSIQKNKSQTLRSCPGFIEMFKDSIVIPLWTDISITYKGNRLIKVEIPGINPGTEGMYIEQHHPDQWGDGFKNSMHLKIINNWYIKCDEMTPFMMHDPTWHKENVDQWTVLPGVLEFQAQHAAHINMLLPFVEEETTVNFEAGTAIAYLTPMIDTSPVIKTKWLPFEEFISLKQHVFTFNNLYAKAKKLLKGE